MTFVNFGLLAGAAFVAVPIILHLVMRRQPQRIEFPPLRLLKLRREANRRRLQLRHWLLLALRCLAIGLLAAALAQPIISPSGSSTAGSGPVAAALVFDTSARLEYRHENRSRLTEAQELGAWLLEQLPIESRVAISDGSVPRATFSVDLGAATQRVERLRTSATARHLTDLVDSAIDLIAETPSSSREIYVFTDLSDSAWDADAQNSLAGRLEQLPDIGVYLVDVGADKPHNFGLGSLRLDQQTLSVGNSLVISATAIRLGAKADRNVELLVADAGGTLQNRATQTVAFDEEHPASIEMSLAGLPAGTHQGMLRISGDDPLAIDNARFFTVDVREAWPVLLAAPRLEQAVYLQEAIAPKAMRGSGKSRFDCSAVKLDKLGQETLSDYAAVCLLDPTPLPEAVAEQLLFYVQRGGRLALFLGAAAQPIDEFNSSTMQKLLPAPLKRQSVAETYLAPKPQDHSMLRRFADLGDGVPWQAFPVFRYWQMGEPAAGSQLVSRFANRDPAILLRSVGRGQTLLWTTPISDPANLRGKPPWNVLPTGIEPWPFVMLVNETMIHLVGSSEATLNYLAGQTAILPLRSAAETSQVLLTTPDGKNVRVTVEPQSDRAAISSTAAIGNYRVQSGGIEGGVDRGFSVNVPDDVSWLARVGTERLNDLLGKDRYKIVRGRGEIARSHRGQSDSWPLFPWLIAICIAALALEQLLANRFYGGPSRVFQWPFSGRPQQATPLGGARP